MVNFAFSFTAGRFTGRGPDIRNSNFAVFTRKVPTTTQCVAVCVSRWTQQVATVGAIALYH